MASQQIMFPGPNPPSGPPPPQFTFPSQGPPKTTHHEQFNVDIYSVDEGSGEKTFLENFQGKASEIGTFVVNTQQGQIIVNGMNPQGVEPFKSYSLRNNITRFLKGSDQTLELKNPNTNNTILILEKNTSGAPAAAPSSAKAPKQAPFEFSQAFLNGFKKVGGKKRKTRKHSQRRRKTRKSLKSKH